MGGDNKLGVRLYQLVDLPQQRQKTRRGQRRFRLIQQIKALSTKAVLHQGQKALPVGLLVEGDAAVAVDEPRAKGWGFVHLIDIGGHIVEALRPEEKAVPGVAPPGDGQILPQD